MEYRDAVIIILIAVVCIVFFVTLLKKANVCCPYCGAVSNTEGLAISPPKEHFAPVNTKLEYIGPKNARTMGALPLAEGEKNHKMAGSQEFLIDQTAMGRA